jgi:hypothetical protein
MRRSSRTITQRQRDRLILGTDRHLISQGPEDVNCLAGLSRDNRAKWSGCVFRCLCLLADCDRNFQVLRAPEGALGTRLQAPA